MTTFLFDVSIIVFILFIGFLMMTVSELRCHQRGRATYQYAETLVAFMKRHNILQKVKW